MAVESRGDLASRHGSIGRFAAAHSWSYRSDNPICTRTHGGGHCHVKSADFDWIIDTPGLVGWFEMTAPPHLQFGTVALDQRQIVV